MIIYPKDIIINKKMEFELGKYRMKMLDKTLRLLGIFEFGKSIRINSHKIQPNGEVIFEIKDQNNTTFSFINFDLNDTKDANPKRYEENFYLTMQTDGSDIQFVYDFLNMDNKSEESEFLRIIELNTYINYKTKVSIQRFKDVPVKLKVQEKDKIYEIELNMEDDNIVSFIMNFKNLKKEISQLEEINLENLIKLIKEEVYSCFVKKGDEMIAALHFSDNKLCYYEYTSGNKKITTMICEDKAIRTLEMTKESNIKYKEELTNKNYDKIFKEAKMLLKIK